MSSQQQYSNQAHPSYTLIRHQHHQNNNRKQGNNNLPYHEATSLTPPVLMITPASSSSTSSVSASRTPSYAEIAFSNSSKANSTASNAPTSITNPPDLPPGVFLPHLLINKYPQQPIQGLRGGSSKPPVSYAQFKGQAVKVETLDGDTFEGLLDAEDQINLHLRSAKNIQTGHAFNLVKIQIAGIEKVEPLSSKTIAMSSSMSTVSISSSSTSTSVETEDGFSHVRSIITSQNQNAPRKHFALGRRSGQLTNQSNSNANFQSKNVSQASTKPGFRTDSETTAQMKRYVGSQARELQRWTSSSMETMTSTAVDFNEEARSHQLGRWDQFKANEELLLKKTTFNEEEYTTPLPRFNSPEEQVMREREAARIAADILGKLSENPHLAEERGQRQAEDADEESLYGAVQRTTAPQAVGKSFYGQRGDYSTNRIQSQQPFQQTMQQSRRPSLVEQVGREMSEAVERIIQEQDNKKRAPPLQQHTMTTSTSTTTVTPGGKKTLAWNPNAPEFVPGQASASTAPVYGMNPYAYGATFPYPAMFYYNQPLPGAGVGTSIGSNHNPTINGSYYYLPTQNTTSSSNSSSQQPSNQSSSSSATAPGNFYYPSATPGAPPVYFMPAYDPATGNTYMAPCYYPYPPSYSGATNSIEKKP